MRRYNDNDRNHAREYTQTSQEEYRDREREAATGHEPFDRPGALARARVVVKRKYNDPGRNFKEMLQEFRRRVSNAGIMHDFKAHQYYESKGEKNRKAKRESQKKLLMDALTKKIVAGERVEGHGGMVKKIMANLKKEKEKREKRRERQNRPHHHDEGGGGHGRYREE